MSRAETKFDDKIKVLIAQRAGYKCSYPSCGKTLVGPGQTNNDFVNIGEVAHIYSAVPNGPRTDGGLSDDELKRPENGIYLCRSHHKLIDRKSKSTRYTSDMLSRMKSRHEFLISAELGEHNYPINWISYIKVIKSPMFNNELVLRLGKVTFVHGNNGTGKSVITNLLFSVFSQTLLPSWKKYNTNFVIETALDNPVLSRTMVEIDSGKMTYIVNNERFPFVPYDFQVFYLEGNIRILKDDVQTIANCIGCTRDYLVEIISTIKIKKELRTKGIQIKNIRKRPYVVETVCVDLDVGWKDQPFKSCSTTEQATVILDLVISLAVELSKFKSVLLFVDWIPLVQFDDSNIQKYLDYLQSQEAHFQTVFVAPTEKPKAKWTGWTVAKLINKTPNTIITHTIK